MKFKIGDKVRIKVGNCDTKECDWNKGMKEHEGLETRISDVISDKRDVFKLEGGKNWCWSSEWLELLEESLPVPNSEETDEMIDLTTALIENKRLKEEKLRSDEKVVEFQKLLAEKNEEYNKFVEKQLEVEREYQDEIAVGKDKYDKLMLKYQTKKADIEVLKREANDYMMFHTMEDKPELIEFVKHRLDFVEADHDNNVVKFMDSETHLPIDITTATLVFLEGNEVCLFKSYEDVKGGASNELEEKLNDSYKEYKELCAKYFKMESKKDFIIDALIDKCKRK